ncbi:hypothetical protein C8250_033835 [Streptomyces sp. So13.3]|uniref:hypothetical protein n=1 Tax=Streptomyces TaxID=1883 RepID=UPI0011072FD6|nr:MULTISPECIES: hypothetical protein [Streptomyces]MCZ4103765.1 hypothetical protein [Streptomyces sp. H39-C1]QNA76202.1 hypothetical protein C8250_033835 [Streptomyces sp. So13.3]
MASAATSGNALRIAGWVCRVAAAAGLAIDAYIHAKLADQYDAVSATISQGALFRVEAGLASLAALLIVAWRRPLGDAFGWLVAAGGLAAILLYRYVDVGALGPLPDMYEPIWSTDKKLSVAAQILAIITTTALLMTRHTRRISTPK